jgi:predicted transcriptional regulator
LPYRGRDILAWFSHWTSEEGEVRAKKVAYFSRRYGRIRQQINHLQSMDLALSDAPDGQISLTDPNARAMAASARISGAVRYNA